ncbi:hypothetical protein OG555_05385 [Kribbella sp. NBC_01484]|uniref:hypothetical protein n=1 Tax=Kribbella sp. NBC_01484 TaxID=2903579 RepID=UPI002E317BC7|nr:hypothetical protein [Kribbella sp. NBC_01484]
MSNAAEFDARQNGVIKALQDRSPKLAGIYKTALRTLRTDPDVDCEAARVSSICHCMRELMANLPGLLADTAIPRPKPSSSALVAKLPNLLAKHPDVDLGVDQDVVPVPKVVARQLDALIRARIQEDGRNRSNAAALVTGSSDAEHPAIKQWRDAYEFFVGWAHLDRNHERERELPSDEEIRSTMRVVEDVIEVRTAVFFENLHSLEDLLAEINGPLEEDA